MDKLTVLVVDDIPLAALSAPPFSDLTMIDWVVINDFAEADQKIEEHLPHLIIADVSLGGKPDGMKWFRRLRQGKFFRTPVIAISSSLFKTDIEDAHRMGAEDTMMKAAGHAQLTRKILAMVEKIEKLPVYRYLGSKRTPVEALLNVSCKIVGVSETGLCIATKYTNLVPVELPQVESELFSKIGISEPLRLVVMDSVRDPQDPTGPARRNFCLVKGWKKQDAVKIRSWAQTQQLSRSF